MTQNIPPSSFLPIGNTWPVLVPPIAIVPFIVIAIVLSILIVGYTLFMNRIGEKYSKRDKLISYSFWGSLGAIAVALILPKIVLFQPIPSLLSISIEHLNDGQTQRESVNTIFPFWVIMMPLIPYVLDLLKSKLSLYKSIIIILISLTGVISALMLFLPYNLLFLHPLPLAPIILYN